MKLFKKNVILPRCFLFFTIGFVSWMFIACNDEGDGPNSPSGLQVSLVSVNRVSISWQDNSANEDGFKIERKKGEEKYFYAQTVTANISSISDLSLEYSTGYTFRVRAYNSAGISSPSNEVAVTTGALDLVHPDTTVESDLPAIGYDSEAEFTFFANEDNSTFECRLDDGDWATCTSPASYSDLSSGYHFFEVRAIDPAGNVDPTPAARAWIAKLDLEIPSNLWARAASSTQIDLSWQDISSNEIGFKIERKDGIFGTYHQISDVAANTTSFSDPNLISGMAYFYRIQSYNLQNISAYSNETNSTTWASFWRASKVDAGFDHACALTSGGGVKCWGSNIVGQLGDGIFVDSSTPVDVAGLPVGFISVSAGRDFTCAVTSGGVVKCWGDNNESQLGNGYYGSEATPVDVSGLSGGVVEVSAGADHACALSSGGGVKCWGANWFGQLGDGTDTDSKFPVDVTGISAGEAVTVSSGEDYNCVLTSKGGVKCWGFGVFGQLGDGSSSSSKVPVDVSGLSSGVINICVGADHTCALTFGGGVKCWGSNWQGQLGDGSYISSEVPINVSGLSSGVTDISCGAYYHTCALISGGGVKCWGANWYGELGDGTKNDSNVPVDVSSFPVGAISISAGAFFNCARFSGGGMKCWGNNEYGQLGDGAEIQSNLPKNVVGFSEGITTISSGGHHTCAVTASGGVKCWGVNWYGQLGNYKETNGYYSNPIDVIDENGFAVGATAVSAGGDHTCMVTLKGGAKCWGNNSYGQLGNGYDSPFDIPMYVTGLTSGVVKITASGEHEISIHGGHTCVLTSQGGVKCWGDNESGQLGDGTNISRKEPVDVVGLSSGVIDISAGGIHTCALTQGGGVKCWGDNYYDQLGDGTYINKNIPVDIPGFSSGIIKISAGQMNTCVLSSGGGVECWGWGGTILGSSRFPSGTTGLSAGGNHACLVTSVGGVKCWGTNEHGQLGIGSYEEIDFTGVLGLSNGVIALSAGGKHVCALTSGGGVKCWGSNGRGQLGDGAEIDKKVPVQVVGTGPQ